jgi:hypothetical protein
MEIGHLNSNQGWLFSKGLDLSILFLPIWIMWAVFLGYQNQLENTTLPMWMWVIFILGIDVSHVWSTLFRTYADKDDYKSHKRLLWIAPVICIATSISILSFSILWFWRVMAYLAIFHFIKQQYGFTAIYGAKSKVVNRFKKINIDKTIIYIATIYPVIFWHFNSQSTFNWFVEGDFLAPNFIHSNQIELIFFILNFIYWSVIGLWILIEIKSQRANTNRHWGKVLWVTTTALNWWLGIVYFNSDLVFSVSNVLAHGVPYLMLIYLYKLKKEEITTHKTTTYAWCIRWGLKLIFSIFILAFIEEYFWDMFVRNEMGSFFEFIYPYRFKPLTASWGLIIATAILSLPQQVHYIVDGYIWKMDERNQLLKPILIQNES